MRQQDDSHPKPSLINIIMRITQSVPSASVAKDLIIVMLHFTATDPAVPHDFHVHSSQTPFHYYPHSPPH